MPLARRTESYCKLTLNENGKETLVRRVHLMMVQSADGHLYSLRGAHLPDAINLYSADSKEGASAQVLLNAPPTPSLSSLTASFLNGSRARDLAFMFVGMFVGTGLLAVADVLARILNP